MGFQRERDRERGGEEVNERKEALPYFFLICARQTQVQIRRAKPGFGHSTYHRCWLQNQIWRCRNIHLSQLKEDPPAISRIMITVGDFSEGGEITWGRDEIWALACCSFDFNRNKVGRSKEDILHDMGEI